MFIYKILMLNIRCKEKRQHFAHKGHLYLDFTSPWILKVVAQLLLWRYSRDETSCHYLRLFHFFVRLKTEIIYNSISVLQNFIRSTFSRSPLWHTNLRISRQISHENYFEWQLRNVRLMPIAQKILATRCLRGIDLSAYWKFLPLK
jgi:hypothetical protein